MSNRRTRPVRLALAALALVVVGALGVSASAFGRSGAASCGTVTIDENAWAGATANVYVVKYVLEKNLGCKVNIEKGEYCFHMTCKSTIPLSTRPRT